MLLTLLISGLIFLIVAVCLFTTTNKDLKEFDEFRCFEMKPDKTNRVRRPRK